VTADAIYAALERAFVLVTIGLSVRVATSVALVLAFLLSPGGVGLVAGREVRLGWFVGVFVHPGWLFRFGPAAIAALVGLVFWVAMTRWRRSQNRVPVA